jgi:hypothetical protein
VLEKKEYMADQMPKTVARIAKSTALPISSELEPLANAIIERAVRAFFFQNPHLRTQKGPKAPRTVVQKVFNIEPGALDQSLRVQSALVQENERAEGLLAQLKQARADLSAAADSTLQKG